jgi:hypothetical protein
LYSLIEGGPASGRVLGRSQNLNPTAEIPKPKDDNDFGNATPPVTALCQRATSNLPSDLTTVIDAWDRLPEAVRAGIVAMVKASDREP